MMKKVKKGSALVVLLALALSMMIIPKAYAAKEIDTAAKCSLNFELGSVVFEEVKTLQIDVDLYKVADVDRIGNYTAVEGYELGTINSETTAEEWQTMAEAAMTVVLENDMEPTASSTAAEGFDDELSVGLYLVVVNTAQSETYEYSFTPYLVSLPNNYYYSSGNDGWTYEVTTSMKPERTDLYGNLVIEKDLTSFNATVGGATFVFQVEATKNYKVSESAADDIKVVYSNVVSLTFEEAGKQSITIENLPAGAIVTVKEVYSGGSYEVVGEDTVETVIVAEEDAVIVTFENTYNGKLNGGSGVVNHFEEGEGGWTWTSSKDSK